MNRSEESITLMTSYRLPHHGYRSFTFVQDDVLPSVITQNSGRKRIFILFFCVVPPSQYPPSGFAGHLLINKEAYPIPILSVRIPFLNTAANPSLMFRMTPYSIPSFRAEVRMLYENEEKSQHDTERRIYYSDDTLRFPLITAADPSHSFRMTFNVSLTTTANPLLLFRMTPNGNHMLRLLTHS